MSSTGFLLVGPLSIVVLAILFLFTVLGLAALSVAVARVAGGNGSDGRRGGCLPGCLAAATLTFLTLLGAVGVAGFVALGTASLATTVVSRVEVDVPDEGGGDRLATGSNGERLTIGVEVRGNLGAELAELVRRVVRDEVDLSIRRGHDERGAFAVLELALPVDRGDLRELEREIQHELDELDLPHGSIRLRHSRDL